MPARDTPDLTARWLEVDRYLESCVVQPDATIEEAVAASSAAGLPPHEVSPLQGRLLTVIAKLCRPRRVLEIGTLGGVSAIYIARGLPRDGEIVTLEVDPSAAAVAGANFRRAGLADRVSVHLGPAVETLSRLEGPFDLIFVDADKQQNDAYLCFALRLSRPGTVIIADNVVRAGTVADAASSDPRVQGIRRSFERIGSHSGFTATAVQTVGVKGWDGFFIGIVGDGAA